MDISERKDRGLLDNPVVEWMYRGVVITGLCAGMYLKQNFVTKEEFEANDTRLRKVEDAIIEFTDTQKLNMVQAQQIQDHEGRIRVLESKTR